MSEEKFVPMYPLSAKRYHDKVRNRNRLLNDESVITIRNTIRQHRRLNMTSGSLNENVLVPPLLKNKFTNPKNKPFYGFTRDRNGSWNFTSLQKMIEKQEKTWDEDQLTWFLIYKPYGLGKVLHISKNNLFICLNLYIYTVIF